VNPNWFESFFEGLTLDMWRAAMTPEQTAREVDFLFHHLNVQPGMCVLDVPCGNGRHAVELSRRGLRMTGLDLSLGFLEEARRRAPEIEWVHGDMRNLPWRGRFDAAYCWGNSFAYFDNDQSQRFLKAIATALRPGGRFLLESGAVSESLLPVMKPERQMKVGDIDFSSRNTYDALDGRMDITYTFVRGEEREVKSTHQWVHSAAELNRMLSRAGLKLVSAFGDWEDSPYALGSPRFMGIAEKILSILDS
jgi:SAM-dependent methyltransferase